MSLRKIYYKIRNVLNRHQGELRAFVKERVYNLETDGRIIIPQPEKIGEFQGDMEKFFNEHTVPVIKMLAEQVRLALLLSVSNFEEDGADLEDVKYIEESLGVIDGKIQKYRDGKMTVLFALGSIKVIENDIASLLANSFTGMVTRTDLWRACESTVNRKYNDFFRTYAIGAALQSYNAAQVSFARKYDYKKFVYQGGIIQETRDFCEERAGLEFHRDQGHEWNELEWKGKIQGVDFFIQCGGYNCLHYIEWVKD